MKQGVAGRQIRWPMPDGSDSLVLSVAPGGGASLRARVEIDGIAFAPKSELHITVIGNRLGRELREVFAAPWLRAAVSAAFDRQDWRFTRNGRHWLLRKPFVEDGDRCVAHSIIECIELPAMASFHRDLGWLLGRQLPLPPPHVTLYVAGRMQGIGVSSPARLRAFAVREVHGLS